MKSLFVKFFMVAVFISIFFQSVALAGSNPVLKFNSKTINSDVPSKLVNNRVLVPIRIISEQLGHTVKWDRVNNAVIINPSKGDGNVTPSPRKIQLVINGKKVTTDVAPQIVRGRVMVPIRVISESLNANVLWDVKSKEVLIVELDQLVQDSAQSIRTFVQWATATYNNPDGELETEEFNKWVNQKLNEVGASKTAVLMNKKVLERMYSSQIKNDSELANIYSLISDATKLMEYKSMQHNIILEDNAETKLEDISKKLDAISQ
ncbi:Copper amine oxidase N-terminal domain-containing protein [Paenibacillaceae bacterium GAS479]|nr:Copper amine oxidase N-terminal domain-containing protein [Paenibacillaceae bacterium GAS479]